MHSSYLRSSLDLYIGVCLYYFHRFTQIPTESTTIYILCIFYYCNLTFCAGLSIMKGFLILKCIFQFILCQLYPHQHMWTHKYDFCTYLVVKSEGVVCSECNSRMNLTDGMLHHEGTPTPTCPACTNLILAELKGDAAPPLVNLKHVFSSYSRYFSPGIPNPSDDRRE